MNKYYEMFINDNVDESILKVNYNSLSFEDHFWHYACMSLYYKKTKQFYLHKKSLISACDLNYYYNAMIYFDANNVLPNNYKKYIKPFEHKMKNDKLESLILETNKRDKKSHFKEFLLYSLVSLIVLPIMLILVLVFKMDSTTAAIVAIIGLLLGQTLVTPASKQRKQIKNQKIESSITKEERMFFDYMLLFYNLLKDPKLVALVKADNEDEKNIIVECIKKNKPLPEEIVNKKDVKQKVKKVKTKK